MIVLELTYLAVLPEIETETSSLGPNIWFEGFEDVYGRNMNKSQELVEYIKFADETAAVQFILEYGDKYHPRKSEHAFIGGIKPL